MNRNRPSSFWQVGLSILFLGVLSINTVPSSANSKAPSSATFYIQDLEPAYQAMATADHIFHLCHTNFGMAACRAKFGIQVDKLDVNVHAFDAIKTFWRGYADKEQDQFRSVDNLYVHWMSARQALNKASLNYEITFLARWGASGAVCPRVPNDDIAEHIQTFEKVDFYRFWQLSPEDAAKLHFEINRQEKASIQSLKDKYTKEECTAIRKFGTQLAFAFKDKIRPYVSDDFTAMSDGKRYSDLVGFIWAVAAIIELQVERANGGEPPILEILKLSP